MDIKKVEALKVFFITKFPILFYGILAICSVCGLFFFWSAAIPEAAMIFTWTLPFAALSHLLFLLVLSLATKNYRSEQNNQYKPFFATAFLVWVLLNTLFSQSRIVFSCLSLYSLLIYKSFFAQGLERHPLLKRALSSFGHYFAALYLLSLFSVDQSMEVFSLKNALLALAFWCGVFAWDVSGEMHSHDDEESFPTYSAAFGPQGAAFAPLAALMLHLATLVYLSKSFFYAQLFMAGLTTLYAVYFMVVIGFMLNPPARKGENLQKSTGAYLLFSSVLVLAVAMGEHIR